MHQLIRLSLIMSMAQAATIAMGSPTHSELPCSAELKELLAGELASMRELLDTLVQEDADLRARIDKVEATNSRLEKLLDSAMSEKAELEDRVEYLEAITARKEVPRTCQDLKNLGVTKSGEYMIDPDGAGIGEAPITVHCDLTTGATVIRHNVNGTVKVKRCPAPGCDVTEVTYDAPLQQIRALAGLSAGCTQAIRYECFASPLIRSAQVNLASWVDIEGKPNYYWNGNHTSDNHTCACGDAGSCIYPEITCNCDANAPRWLSDEGTLTNKAILPVQQLRFGGLRFDEQQAAFELGSFQCSGKKAFRAAESCKTLRMAGATAPGYYIVDGANGVHFDAVICNMDLDVDDPNFQEKTSLKFPEFPVAFDFRRINAYTTPGTIVPYETAVVNVGGAMTMEGVFTAPLNGIYVFTFVTEVHRITQTAFWIRLNKSDHIARTFSIPKSGSVETCSETVIISLTKGDKIDVYLQRGSIVEGIGTSHADMHFSGHLVYPL